MLPLMLAEGDFCNISSIDEICCALDSQRVCPSILRTSSTCARILHRIPICRTSLCCACSITPQTTLGRQENTSILSVTHFGHIHEMRKGKIPHGFAKGTSCAELMDIYKELGKIVHFEVANQSSIFVSVCWLKGFTPRSDKKGTSDCPTKTLRDNALMLASGKSMREALEHSSK